MRLSCNWPETHWCSCGSIEVFVKVSGLQCLLRASSRPLRRTGATEFWHQRFKSLAFLVFFDTARAKPTRPGFEHYSIMKKNLDEQKLANLTPAHPLSNLTPSTLFRCFFADVIHALLESSSRCATRFPGEATRSSEILFGGCRWIKSTWVPNRSRQAKLGSFGRMDC